MGMTALWRSPKLGLSLALLVAAAVWLVPGADKARGAKAAPVKFDGAVYVMTNNPAGNAVQVFFRRQNGQLVKGPRVRTRGKGAAMNPPFGFPIADSAGSVTLSPDRKLLFVTNLGSNTITSFQVTPGGLRVADVESSRGSRPVSVTAHAWSPARLRGRPLLLYALNEGNATEAGSVAGFMVDARGNMTFLSGSVRPLATVGFSAQVLFNPSGRTLTVSQRGGVDIPAAFGGGRVGQGPDELDTFVLAADGRPGQAIPTPSKGEDPFGFAYTRRNVLVMSDSGFDGTASTYQLDPATGALRHIGTIKAEGGGTCWVSFGNNQKHVFMTNSLTGNISRFELGSDGALRLLGTTPTFNRVPLDEDTDRGNRWLYVLESRVLPVGRFQDARVQAFRIEKNGDLTAIGLTSVIPFKGATGLAAT